MELFNPMRKQGFHARMLVFRDCLQILNEAGARSQLWHSGVCERFHVK